MIFGQHSVKLLQYEIPATSVQKNWPSKIFHSEPERYQRRGNSMLKETDYNAIIGVLGCIAEESRKHGVSIKTIKRILQQYTDFPNEPKDGPERGRWLQKKFGTKNDEVHKGEPIRERTEVKQWNPKAKGWVPVEKEHLLIVTQTKSLRHCRKCKKSTEEYRWINLDASYWHEKCWEELLGETKAEEIREPFSVGEKVNQCFQCGLSSGLSSGKLMKDESGYFWHIDCYKEYGEECKDMAQKIYDKQEDVIETKVEETKSQGTSVLSECVGCKTGEWLAVEQYYGKWWHPACWENQPVPHKEVTRERYEVRGVQAGKSETIKQCPRCDSSDGELKRDASGRRSGWWHEECLKIRESNSVQVSRCDDCGKLTTVLDDENCCPDCRDTSEPKEVEEDVYQETGNKCIRCNSDLGRMHKDADGHWWHKKCHSDYRRGEGQTPPAVVQCTKCDCLLDSKDDLAMKLCRNCQDDDDGEEQPSRNKKKTKRKLTKTKSIKKCEKCREVVKHDKWIELDAGDKWIKLDGLYWHHGCWDGTYKNDSDSISKMLACVNCKCLLDGSSDLERRLCLPCLNTMIWRPKEWHLHKTMDGDSEIKTVEHFECVECETVVRFDMEKGSDLDRKLCSVCVNKLSKMHKQDRKNVIHINAETVRTMIPSLVKFPDSLEGFPHSKLLMLADVLDKNRPKVKKSKSTAINDTRLRKWCREKLASLSVKEVEVFREDGK